MIPNLRMGYFHQREYLERPCITQTDAKFVKKPLKDTMERFEYSSLLSSKTYSILSYIVGGFVGSKSQMNNNKHNLSYDLSAAIFNLLNPCKFEREKGFKKLNENFYNTATKISPEGYDKYIVKSSHKGKMFDLGLELLENYMLSFQDPSYKSKPTMGGSFSCDENKVSSGSCQSTMENSKLKDCLGDSVDVTDQVSICEDEGVKKELSNHSINYLASHRFRQQSECSIESTDSESFIIFDGPDQDEEKESEGDWKLENFDFGSEEEEQEDDSSCDDYDICSFEKELVEANEKWKKNYQDVKTQDDKGQRKVRFNDDVKVNKIVAWDYAYRAARPGPWEQMARDRVRFRERILRLSPIISPILRKDHREKIYKELYS